jgi:hypothetical protein
VAVVPTTVRCPFRTSSGDGPPRRPASCESGRPAGVIDRRAGSGAVQADRSSGAVAGCPAAVLNQETRAGELVGPPRNDRHAQYLPGQVRAGRVGTGAGRRRTGRHRTGRRRAGRCPQRCRPAPGPRPGTAPRSSPRRSAPPVTRGRRPAGAAPGSVVIGGDRHADSPHALSGGRRGVGRPAGALRFLVDRRGDGLVFDGEVVTVAAENSLPATPVDRFPGRAGWRRRR